MRQVESDGAAATAYLSVPAQRVASLRQDADMAETHIPMSTTDFIPGLESEFVVATSLMWVSEATSMQDAEETALQWAWQNNWDAVVGVRFFAESTVDTGLFAGTVHTSHRITLYGTAIRWRKNEVA